MTSELKAATVFGSEIQKGRLEWRGALQTKAMTHGFANSLQAGDVAERWEHLAQERHVYDAQGHLGEINVGVGPVASKRLAKRLNLSFGSHLE